MYYCCGITEKGAMDHNEDAMLVGKNAVDYGETEQKLMPPFICAVSDGVSGELSGELASRTCIELVRDIKYSRRVNLTKKLMEVHESLAEIGSESSDNRNMQATLCGIAVDENDRILAVNVGDSRLYRFRGGHLRQLSRDQSLVQLLYEEGTITKEERRTHVHRNIIFPVLGNLNSKPEIAVHELEDIQYGDILLLCTDGLSDYVSPITIGEILELPKSLPKRLRQLVDTALENGSEDNITVIAVVYCEG